MNAGRRAALGCLGVLPFLLTACGRDARAPALASGRPLPTVAIPDLEGLPRALGEAGRPSLINFWATWCPPCRAEMGGLERLHREFGGAGLVVQGVSVDTDANLVREFILQQGIGFPILLDHDGRVTQGTLGVRIFPTTLLVRRDGSIAEVVVGERDWDGAAAHDSARALL